MAKPLKYSIGITFFTSGEEAPGDEAPDTTSLEKNLEAIVSTWAAENDINIDDVGMDISTSVEETS